MASLTHYAPWARKINLWQGVRPGKNSLIFVAYGARGQKYVTLGTYFTKEEAALVSARWYRDYQASRPAKRG